VRPVSGPAGNIIDLNQKSGQVTTSASLYSGLALAPHAVRPYSFQGRPIIEYDD